MTKLLVTKLEVASSCQSPCRAHGLFVVGGSACSAYMSSATQDVTIDALEPAMQIPAGFSMQGALRLFGARVGFNMGFGGTMLVTELDTEPLKFFYGMITVRPAH